MQVGILPIARRTQHPIPSTNSQRQQRRIKLGCLRRRHGPDILIIALKQRCHQDNLGTEKETLAKQFRLHLHRGIGYLAGDPNIKKIEDLVAIALSPEKLRN